MIARRSSRGHVRSCRGHPTCLVADLLAAERPPRARALRAQPGRVDVAAADAVEQEIEREEQILGRRRAEAVSESHVAADRHARSRAAGPIRRAGRDRAGS